MTEDQKTQCGLQWQIYTQEQLDAAVAAERERIAAAILNKRVTPAYQHDAYYNQGVDAAWSAAKS